MPSQEARRVELVEAAVLILPLFDLREALEKGLEEGLDVLQAYVVTILDQPQVDSIGATAISDREVDPLRDRPLRALLGDVRLAGGIPRGSSVEVLLAIAVDAYEVLVAGDPRQDPKFYLIEIGREN